MPASRARSAARDRVGVWLAALCLLGCEDRGPTGAEAVVERFVNHMRAYRAGVEDSRGAYELLFEAAKQNLSERAERASDVIGRQVEPHDMLVPAFDLSFIPKRYLAETHGNWAVVQVRGSSLREHSSIRCVREAEGWRIVMEMPPLSPIRRRQHRE